jgi:hypothetical protein
MESELRNNVQGFAYAVDTFIFGRGLAVMGNPLATAALLTVAAGLLTVAAGLARQRTTSCVAHCFLCTLSAVPDGSTLRCMCHLSLVATVDNKAGAELLIAYGRRYDISYVDVDCKQQFSDARTEVVDALAVALYG